MPLDRDSTPSLHGFRMKRKPLGLHTWPKCDDGSSAPKTVLVQTDEHANEHLGGHDEGWWLLVWIKVMSRINPKCPLVTHVDRVLAREHLGVP